MYNYNLQNIKAIPSSLSKTSAFVYNTRVWPFLEVFSCTPQEKEAMKNKIKFDGMTVGVIDKIRNYTDFNGRLIRGQVIRINENIKEDAHMTSEIYNEIMKGVYL